MFITAKQAAFIATAVVAAHAVIGAASFSKLQREADVAIMPIVVAERIDVKPTQIYKAEAIIVRARAVDRIAAASKPVVQ